MSDNAITDEALLATINEALAILAEQPSDDYAFSRVAYKDQAVGVQIVLLATVRAITELAPPIATQAILVTAGDYAEEFAVQYERATADETDESWADADDAAWRDAALP